MQAGRNLGPAAWYKALYHKELSFIARTYFLLHELTDSLLLDDFFESTPWMKKESTCTYGVYLVVLLHELGEKIICFGHPGDE